MRTKSWPGKARPTLPREPISRPRHGERRRSTGLSLRSLRRLSRHPTPVEVAGVVTRVLVEEPLVVLLGRPELRRREDLGHDGLLEVALGLLFRAQRLLLLLGVVGED